MGNKIKKIVFVEPASIDYHVYEKYPLPRLGSIILATSLKELGYDVRVFVESISGIEFEELLSADLVAISTITPTVNRGYELGRLLREEGVKVVMGGPHVTFMPEEALKFADYVIMGEGDDVFLDFLNALQNGDDLSKIPGLCFREKNEIFISKEKARCENLNRLPFPDFSLIHGYRGFSIYPMMTSRGCPYDCTFCSVTAMFGRKYRFIDNERVIREIRASRAEWIFFYDDNFAANPKRTKELLKTMIKNKITPHWTAQVRIEVAKDQELMELMKASGCHTCYIGIESINPYTLELYKKKQTLDDIKRCIDKFHSAGIKLHGMFVLGSDEDDKEVFKETVNFAKKCGLETVQFMILTPIPGTLLYKKLDEERRIITKNWWLYDGHHVVYQPRKMSPLELQVRTIKAMGRFYSVWQAIKSLLKLDITLFVLRLYAKRILAKWKRKNSFYIDYLKNIKNEIGLKFESLSRGVGEDIIDGIRKIVRKREERKQVRM
jgi:radical SAM superfamily enzyme YgiQ (UPF0313 family)